MEIRKAVPRHSSHQSIFSAVSTNNIAGRLSTSCTFVPEVEDLKPSPCKTAKGCCESRFLLTWRVSSMRQILSTRRSDDNRRGKGATVVLEWTALMELFWCLRSCILSIGVDLRAEGLHGMIDMMRCCADEFASVLVLMQMSLPRQSGVSLPLLSSWAPVSPQPCFCPPVHLLHINTCFIN